jgi:NAD(P)-dependent dehydrogenase (short-subunit alcohol dehydrogenase family)
MTTQINNATDIFRLESKSILVTGASSGIGRAIAIACAQAGAKVTLHGRDLGRLQATLMEMQGSSHEVLQGDLQDPDDVIALADQCQALSGIVHCAGVHGVAPMRLVQRSMLLQVFQINYLAPMILTQRLLMKRKIHAGGSILFMSSIAAHTGKVGVGPYSGSKAALLGSMRPLALEVAKHGIRVNALSPGIVRTPLFEGNEDWLNNEVAANYPLGLGEPEDIANAAVFFLSDSSRKITGIDLSIDGGVFCT